MRLGETYGTRAWLALGLGLGIGLGIGLGLGVRGLGLGLGLGLGSRAFEDDQGAAVVLALTVPLKVSHIPAPLGVDRGGCKGWGVVGGPVSALRVRYRRGLGVRVRLLLFQPPWLSEGL